MTANSQSVVSICNLSLLSIGSQTQVSSITPSDRSTAADACSTLFTFVYQQLARTAYWNCLRNQATLTLIAAAAGTAENPDGTTLPLPPQPWLYQYQLPSDCLQARFIVPTFPTAGVTAISPALVAYGSSWMGPNQIPFHVAYATDTLGNPLQVILTNQIQAQLVYTVNQPNPLTWDSSFTAAMVASLAAYLVPALSLHMPLMQAQRAIAERFIADARVRDANEGSTQQDNVPDWIRARSGGYGAAWNNGNCGYGFDNMAWPG